VIYEIRTYDLVLGGVAEVEERTAEALSGWGAESPLVGFFHTEVGPLNQVVHIWRFANLEERARIRAAALGDPRWPPATGEFILNQQIELVTPFPFVPKWQPGPEGPLYELRQYTFRPGTLPIIRQAWEEALPHRLQFSRPALVGSLEFGPAANSIVHIWPYPTMEARAEAQRASRVSGEWPPPLRAHYLGMSSKLLLPASFSPAQ
jgi:hypothetical protein